MTFDEAVMLYTSVIKTWQMVAGYYMKIDAVQPQSLAKLITIYHVGVRTVTIGPFK